MNGVSLFFTFAATSLSAFVVLAPSQEERALWRRTAAIRRTRMPARFANGTDEEMDLPFRQRVVDPFLNGVSQWFGQRTSTKAKSVLEQRLAQAGHPFSLSSFLALRGLSAVGVGLAAFLLLLPTVSHDLLNGLLMIAVLVLLAWRLPDFMLSRMISQRREKIERALPDVLDLLSVSVEAGLGLDGAVQKVGEKFSEPTAGEFRELLKEIRLGTPRIEALRGLADRTGVPDMRTFVAAVIQAEQLGVSIARVLKAQAEALRVKRKQRAQEKAMKLPIKILLPLVMFIFPTLFIVLLGPAVINIMDTLGGM